MGWYVGPMLMDGLPVELVLCTLEAPGLTKKSPVGSAGGVKRLLTAVGYEYEGPACLLTTFANASGGGGSWKLGRCEAAARRAVKL